MGSPLPIIFVYQAVASMHTRHIHACPGNAGVSMDSRLHQKLPELLFNWSCGLLMSPEMVQLSNKASTNSVRCASCHGVLKLPKNTPSHYGLRMLRRALWYKNQVWVWGVEVCFTWFQAGLHWPASRDLHSWLWMVDALSEPILWQTTHMSGVFLAINHWVWVWVVSMQTCRPVQSPLESRFGGPPIQTRPASARLRRCECRDPRC